MGPTRKSRSVNKRYSYTPEVSHSKDGDSVKRSNIRKRKLSDMLGPRWTVEELTHFYDSYRKNGREWKKVAGAVGNRSSEMVEALYTMNRAYLSLPHGTASAAGLIAMMTDHYSNLAGSDSDQESNDGAGSSRRTQKPARGKVQPTPPKASDEKFVSKSPIIVSDYDCLSLLKKKSSGGRPRPVGKRTPRFPVSFSCENINGEGYISSARQGLKLKANANDDEVAHEIAIALAEASQRGGSPQVSGTLNKRAESVMSSPVRHAQTKHNVAEISNFKVLATDTDEEDLEGSAEADAGGFSRIKPHINQYVCNGATGEKGKKFEGKKNDIDNNNEAHLDDIKEECSGTEEDQELRAMRSKLDVEVNDSKFSRSPMQRKKSKKVPFGRGSVALSEEDWQLVELTAEPEIVQGSPAPAEDIPAEEQTADVPAEEQVADVPAEEQAVDVPAEEPAAEVPAVEIPAEEPAADVPAEVLVPEEIPAETAQEMADAAAVVTSTSLEVSAEPISEIHPPAQLIAYFDARMDRHLASFQDSIEQRLKEVTSSVSTFFARIQERQSARARAEEERAKLAEEERRLAAEERRIAAEERRKREEYMADLFAILKTLTSARSRSPGSS